MKNNLHGWLVIDKPAGITSAQVVGKVKRILKPSKIGHAGTLDPFATGVLPLALGEATKTAGYGLDKQKSYEFEITFGESRDTEDLTGKVTAESLRRPSEADIDEALPMFHGEIMQMPPQYSALKVDGKRAYALARKGEKVELKARPVTIYELSSSGLTRGYISTNLMDPRVKPEDDSNNVVKANFSVTCSKGTYVRSLARDIAAMMGCLGYVSALRRTVSGPFDLKQAISLETLEKSAIDAPSSMRLLPPEVVLDDILVLPLGDMDAAKIRQGQKISPSMETPPQEGALISLFHGGKLLAIGKREGSEIKPQRVFNL